MSVMRIIGTVVKLWLLFFIAGLVLAMVLA